MSLIGDERIIHLQRTKVYVFSDSVLCLGKIHQNPESQQSMGAKDQNGSNLLKAAETLTESMESRLNSSGTSSQDSTALQLYGKVTDLLSRLGEKHQRTFTGRECIHVDVQRHLLWIEETMKKNVMSNAKSRFSTCKKDLEKDSGHSLVLVPKRSGIL